MIIKKTDTSSIFPIIIKIIKLNFEVVSKLAKSIPSVPYIEEVVVLVIVKIDNLKAFSKVILSKSNNVDKINIENYQVWWTNNEDHRSPLKYWVYLSDTDYVTFEGTKVVYFDNDSNGYKVWINIEDCFRDVSQTKSITLNNITYTLTIDASGTEININPPTLIKAFYLSSSLNDKYYVFRINTPTPLVNLNTSPDIG